MSIPNWKKRWRKKVKREFKRAIKVEGFEGWFVIIGESLTGKEYKVKRVGNDETFYIPKEYIKEV